MYPIWWTFEFSKPCILVYNAIEMTYTWVLCATHSVHTHGPTIQTFIASIISLACGFGLWVNILVAFMPASLNTQPIPASTNQYLTLSVTWNTYTFFNLIYSPNCAILLWHRFVCTTSQSPDFQKPLVTTPKWCGGKLPWLAAPLFSALTV